MRSVLRDIEVSTLKKNKRINFETHIFNLVTSMDSVEIDCNHQLKIKLNKTNYDAQIFVVEAQS